MSQLTYTEFEKALEEEIGNKRKGKSSSTKVMFIKEVRVELPAESYAGSLDSVEIQFTTNSESAMVNISDKDCFMKQKWMTNGAASLDFIELVKTIPVNKPYIKKALYIGIDANGVAGTTFHIEIDFEYMLLILLLAVQKYVNDWQLSRMISRKY